MAVKKYRPYTPSRRQMTTADFSGLTKKRPEKALTEAKPKSGGRNNRGRITSRFIGGGHKKLYRIIDPADRPRFRRWIGAIAVFSVLQGICVLLLDLDGLKDVNDTQGHDAGDKLLQDLASRLSFFRKTSETLYRLGGDEFALVSHDLTEEMALERAKVIREKISQPYQIYDSLIQIGACIGIVISDGESRTD